MPTWASIGGVLVALAMFMPIAIARPACMPREHAVAALAERFEEYLTARGITAQGSILEVYVSDNGTWSSLLTNPQTMTSCMVGNGGGWTDAPPVPRTETPKGPDA